MFLRPHGDQHHQARGLPGAWNCVFPWMATYPRSCVFANIVAGERRRGTHNSASRAATKMSQVRAFGTSWNARTSTCLQIPTFLNLHKTGPRGKNTFRAFGPKVLSPICISGVLRFRPFVLGNFLFLCMRVSVFLLYCVLLCARVSVFIFYLFLYFVVEVPACRVSPGDATPIGRSRPARKGNKQTQTDQRRMITQ